MRNDLALFALVVIVIAAVVIVARAILREHHGRNKAHGLPMRIVRWHLGIHWTGQPMTDAGWNRRGVKALNPTGHAPRFWYRPQKHRVAIRFAQTEGPLAVLWAMAFYADFAVVAVSALMLAALAWWCWRAYHAVQRRRFRRSWLHPLHKTLSPILDVPLANKPESYLLVPADRSSATVALPVGYRPAKEKERIERAVADALGLESPEVEWQLSGAKPQVEFRRSITPPRVSLEQLADAIKAAGPDELVLGLGKRHQAVSADLHSDSPHVALSMGSGAGKSTAARFVGAQVMFKGGITLWLDVKRISHPWVTGGRLPNAAYAKTPEQIHRALVWAGGELDRRNDVADAATDIEGRVHADVGPRLLVVIEELNLLIPKLRAYWRVYGGDGPSPAIQALADVSAAGRQVRMNLLLIAQRLSAAATGGGDSRENIGTRILGRYSPQAWAMLAGEFKMPAPDDTPGRVQVVTSKVAECQIAGLSGAEAIRLSTSGIVSACPDGMPGICGLPDSDSGVINNYQALPPAETGGLTPGSPGAESSFLVDGISLKEACELGILPVGQATAKTWRRRYKQFPEPVALDGLTQLFDPEALHEFAQARR